LTRPWRLSNSRGIRLRRIPDSIVDRFGRFISCTQILEAQQDDEVNAITRAINCLTRRDVIRSIGATTLMRLRVVLRMGLNIIRQINSQRQSWLHSSNSASVIRTWEEM
jgi:hypothetical protein